jgi:broad specificity phosphatase PhoE
MTVEVPSIPTPIPAENMFHGMNGDHHDVESTPRLPIVLTSFHWRAGGTDVFVAGSFNHWKERIRMDNEGHGIFSKILEVPVGIHSYKFIVDGEWRYAEDQQMVTDDKGNINNGVSITLPTHDVTIPTHWVPTNSAEHQHQGDGATNDEECPSSPRDKPLKNQFLLSGVHCDNSTALADRKLLLVMIGLPARGKSFVSRKLARYLNWFGYQTKVFNLGNYRREHLGSFHAHDFFRADNPEGIMARNKIANEALNDVFGYLKEGGRVAIYDGTNTTKERRKFILQRVKEVKKEIESSLKVIFIEIICNDPKIIDANILSTKVSSPDYVGVDKDKIISDFRERIAHYEQAYQTLDSDELSYIKIFEVGRQIVTNRIYGFLPARIVFFLSNLHIVPRPIYLVRHGEAKFTAEGRIGGDTELTDRGKIFSQELTKWFTSLPTDEIHPQFNSKKDLLVWSSTMQAAAATAGPISEICAQHLRWRALEEIHSGICDGLTEAEVRENYLEEFKAWQANKLVYRYPRGESYEDVIRRLEPVIIELERQRKPVVIIAHTSVIRCLIGYFKNLDPKEIPSVEVPLHQVIKLYAKAYDTQEQRTNLEPHLPPSPAPRRKLPYDPQRFVTM